MVGQTDTRAFEPHDHNDCIDSALTAARNLCGNKGLRLTPIREQVFTFICQSHKPLGAYAILDLLADLNSDQDEKKHRRHAPPTVYRALEFLQDHGLVHRIATLNAFISCCRPARPHQSQFLICRQCDSTVELVSQTLSQAIEQSAVQADFQVDSACVEIIGLCPNCHQDEVSADD
jgi:Fur family transcriptional regulator, zinc uptake regulator